MIPSVPTAKPILLAAISRRTPNLPVVVRPTYPRTPPQATQPPWESQTLPLSLFHRQSTRLAQLVSSCLSTQLCTRGPSTLTTLYNTRSTEISKFIPLLILPHSERLRYGTRNYIGRSKKVSTTNADILSTPKSAHDIPCSLRFS